MTRATFVILCILTVLVAGCSVVDPPATPTSTRVPTITPSPVPTAPPIARTPAPLAPPANRLGVHLLLDDGRDRWPETLWPEYLGYARRAAGEWGYVVQLVRLDDLDPAHWQGFLSACADLHLTPVLRLATTFDRQNGWWTAPPVEADGSYAGVAALYADFVAALDWPMADHFLLVGNEPNHGDEWGGQPDPAAYARFLIDVADALHAVDPGARVLNGGLDPFAPHTGDGSIGGAVLLDSETFLDQMAAAYPDVFTRLDAWASHTYPLGPFTSGPWEQVFQIDTLNGAVNPDHDPPPPGVYNRGINGYEWELFKLAELGAPELPVLITETGWRHAESTHPGALDHAPADLPDVTTTAIYLDLALRGNGGRYPNLPEDGWTPWLDDPRVIGVVFFALNGLPAEWGHTNWLKLDASGTVYGVYPLFDTLAQVSSEF